MSSQKPITEKVKDLMSSPIGPTRLKGIITLAKKRNIGLGEAKFTQSLKIAQSQVQKGI